MILPEPSRFMGEIKRRYRRDIRRYEGDLILAVEVDRGDIGEI